MSPILLTQSTTFIIGPVAQLLGYVMNAIYNVLDLVGIPNIGLSIILFTIIVNVAMLPMTIKQQRTTRLSAKMNPEIQAIQKRYKNKKDQASQMKQQDEIKAVYEKYGTSPTGGCLPLLIQMPILFALYRVIMNIPAYVVKIKDIYTPLVTNIMSSSGYQETMIEIGEGLGISSSKFSYEEANTIIDVLYKFQATTWATLIEKFPDLENQILTTSESLSKLNNFLGISMADSPASNWKSIAILIPILAGLSQFVSAKITEKATQAPSASADDNPMASSMKTMNTVMPLMSVVFCFSLPAGLGLYWIAGAVVRTVIQVIVTKHLNKTDLDELVKKNLEKVNKKREKKGLPPTTVTSNAKLNVRNIEEPKNRKSEEERKQEQKKASDYYNKDAKPGSLASKASMVRKFNEGQKNSK